MLAPRKKLWSTPTSAIDLALTFADLDANDVVYDVGCGDGRVLIQMAAMSMSVQPPHPSSPSAGAKYKYHHCHQFVGIEISPERTSEARANIQKARASNQIPKHVSVEIICANALDTQTVDYTKATVIFLYLVPRGLRLIKDIVWPTTATENDSNSNSNSKSVEGNDNASNIIIGKEEEQAKIALVAAAFDETKTNTETITNQSESNGDSNSTLPSSSDNDVNNVRPRRIITYMSPFDNTQHVQKAYCKVEHQEGAAWPVFLYHVE